MRRRALVAVVASIGLLLVVGCSGDDDDVDVPRGDAPAVGLESVPVDQLGAGHVSGDQRVAYPTLPPMGGAHDRIWADCNGVVYDRPVRTENMVHSLEHGAVWIAYDPELLDEAGVAALRQLVEGEIYLMMSPFPGIGRPISLQSWGHRLQVQSATDPQIVQFINAFRANDDFAPEAGATCDIPDKHFTSDNPPAFDPRPPGPDAVDHRFKGGRS